MFYLRLFWYSFNTAVDKFKFLIVVAITSSVADQEKYLKDVVKTLQRVCFCSSPKTDEPPLSGQLSKSLKKLRPFSLTVILTPIEWSPLISSCLAIPRG